MQSDHRDISATILIEVSNTVMHRFVDREQSLFTSGTCKIAKIQNPNHNTVYFINLNSFYYTLNSAVVFVRIQYDDTVSYLFPHFDTGLSSITLLKNSDALLNFEEVLKNAAILTSWQQSQQNQQLKQKIARHCPQNISTESIVCADKIKKLIKDTGKFLGAAFKTIGGYLSQGVKYVGEYIDQKVDEPTDKGQVNPQTRQKWDKLKKGTSDAIDVSKDIWTKYLQPVVDKGVEYSKQLGKKIQESDNPNIKYARQLAGTSGTALNEAFVGLAEGTTKVGGEIGKSTRKIVNKKYGDDYVKTFLPEEQQTKEQITPKTETEQIKQGDKLYPDLEQKK